MDILFLGTSGHGITTTRNLPSILIDKSILVDCGEGTFRSLLNLNIPISSIKVIFLSHQHADHFLGLISIIWQLAFYSEVKMPCPKIYGPEGIKSAITRIFEITYSSFDHVGFNLDIEELTSSQDAEINFNIGDMEYQVKWAVTSHSPLCYAYQFNNLLTITGDTGAMCQNIIQIAKKCKVLCHEASFPDELVDIAKKVNHSTPTDAARLSKECSIERLLLYHVPDLSKEHEIKFVKNAKLIFQNLEIAHDNMQIII